MIKEQIKRPRIETIRYRDSSMHSFYECTVKGINGELKIKRIKACSCEIDRYKSCHMTCRLIPVRPWRGEI